jgi:hypothetical protein
MEGKQAAGENGESLRLSHVRLEFMFDQIMVEKLDLQVRSQSELVCQIQTAKSSSGGLGLWHSIWPRKKRAGCRLSIPCELRLQTNLHTKTGPADVLNDDDYFWQDVWGETYRRLESWPEEVKLVLPGFLIH